MTKTLLAAFALALFALAAAPAYAQSAPATLAVVNISKMSQRIELKKTMDAEMESLSKDLTQQRTNKENEIDKLREELKQYNADSDLGRETADKILRKITELDAFRTFAQQKILLENRLRTMAMYRAINNAIADYAKAHKILLVLVADDADLAGTRSQEELLSKVATRKVMYADPSLDITDALIEKMNTEAKTAPGKGNP